MIHGQNVQVNHRRLRASGEVQLLYWIEEPGQARESIVVHKQ